MFQKTAIRARRGTNARSNSSRFASESRVCLLRPVTLPPGRDRLPTISSRSATETIRTGRVRVARFNANAAGEPNATMRSTFSPTSSAAKAGKRSPRPSADRYSIRRFRPSTYPNSRTPARRAARSAAFSSADADSNIPTRQILASCRAIAGKRVVSQTPETHATNVRRSITNSRVDKSGARILDLNKNCHCRRPTTGTGPKAVRRIPLASAPSTRIPTPRDEQIAAQCSQVQRHDHCTRRAHDRLESRASAGKSYRSIMGAVQNACRARAKRTDAEVA